MFSIMGDDVASALIFMLLIIIFSQYPTSTSQLDHCLNQTCGNLSVRYPFSIRTTTSPACPTFSSFFELECNIWTGKLYLHNVTHINTPTRLPVLAMLNDSLIVDFGDFKAILNNSCGFRDYSTVSLPSFPGPYFISDDNKFVSIGCVYGTLYAGVLKDDSPQDYAHIDYSDYSDLQMGGCYVLPAAAADQNISCGKIHHACCVSPIPGGLSPRYAVYTVFPYDDGITNSSACNNGASCFNQLYNYATLFHPNYSDFDNAFYALKLKWALPSNQTKDGELIHSSDYACSRNAHPTIVPVVPGYVCSCNPGYAGDGYAKGSDCSDIDECKDPSTNNCILGSTTCHNTEGGYSCTCNSRFYVGDGHRNGSGCKFSPHLRNAFVITAVILGLALLAGSFTFLAVQWKQRMKRKYFMQNGGLELQAYIAARGRETTRLFRAEELKAATNNFSDDMKLGIGGFGTVFKGRIGDGRLVAIKKANRDKAGTADSEQFLNEMAILMQINHRHIVRLLGCCLETATPLLVYEYVSNGNVEESLEAKVDGMKRWEQRLKVARQTAEALAYLHAAASPPILHGDVKSRNVLLDDNLDVKVADFGTSRLVADVDDEEQVSRPASVQGTIGYLDPEYFQTLELTDKSDVYSLGVMLVELITGLKPIDNSRRFSNLAFLFIDHMQKGRGEELIDPRLHHHDHELSAVTRSSIMAVATLARRCLNLLGTERPSMSHVAHTLRHITQSLQGAAGTADIDDEASPLLQQHVYDDQYVEATAGINMDAQNPQYHNIMSSNSTSMSISVELFNAPR